MRFGRSGITVLNAAMQRGLGDTVAAGLGSFADRRFLRGGCGEGEADAEHGDSGKGKLHFSKVATENWCLMCRNE